MNHAKGSIPIALRTRDGRHTLITLGCIWSGFMYLVRHPVYIHFVDVHLAHVAS